jgi:hypothetical protein
LIVTAGSSKSGEAASSTACARDAVKKALASCPKAIENHAELTGQCQPSQQELRAKKADRLNPTQVERGERKRQSLATGP